MRNRLHFPIRQATSATLAVSRDSNPISQAREILKCGNVGKNEPIGIDRTLEEIAYLEGFADRARSRLSPAKLRGYLLVLSTGAHQAGAPLHVRVATLGSAGQAEVGFVVKKYGLDKKFAFWLGSGPSFRSATVLPLR